MSLWQVDQYFMGSPNVDDPVARCQDIRKLQGDVVGYRACFFKLLGFVIIWAGALMANRTPPLHLNACEALKYYLSALDEASTKLPMETRQLLDSEAAACPDDDLGYFDDDDPHQ